MPGGDRTGPMGQGSQTGRGTGYCGGNVTPGAATAGFGGRRRRRRGAQGRGYRNRTGRLASAQPVPAEPTGEGPPPTEANTQNDIAVLQEQANELSRSLREIQSRLAALDETADAGST